jgi:hypothetical protein
MIGAEEITLPSVGNPQNLVNENYKVNVNRGCHIRIHGNTGAAIYMYVSEPGIFYNDHAKKVPAEMAAQAGFDVEPLLRARKKREAMALAAQQIEAEYQEGAGIFEVLETAGDYRLIHIGSERYNIVFDDDTPMNRDPLPLELARKTFRTLAELPEETPVKK